MAYVAFVIVAAWQRDLVVLEMEAAIRVGSACLACARKTRQFFTADFGYVVRG